MNRSSASRAAIIIAGAHVWQDDAFGAVCPRLLLPVANVPLVAHAFRWLQSAGIHRMVLCVNADVSQLQRTLRAGPEEMQVDYYVDRVPRGPAGCARDAATLVPADEYVVLEGGVLPGCPLREILQAHQQGAAPATVVVEPASAVRPGWGLSASPAGIYVLTAAALEQVPRTSYQDLKEGLIARLLRQAAPVTAYAAAHASLRVRDLESYLAVQGEVMTAAQNNGGPPPGYDYVDGACVHRTASIDSGARLVGPVMVGPGTEIAAGSFVVGPAVLGRNCLLGAETMVSRSVLWDGCVLGRRSQVDLSLLTTEFAADAGATFYGAIGRNGNGRG